MMPTYVEVPLNIESPAELQRFLIRLVEELNLYSSLDTIPQLLEIAVVPSATYAQSEAQAVAMQVITLQDKINIILNRLQEAKIIV